MSWERPDCIFARRALTSEGWQHDVRIAIANDGTIAAVASGSSPSPGQLHFDLLLPGIANLHSHAFQRALAGLTETASPQGQTNFWTWREAMYRLANRLTPEQLQVVATALYIELLKHGYTSVGEFHYLHHDLTGKPYANLAELSDHVIAAAHATGIHITHLPVLYETADFGGASPRPEQRRFLHTPEAYLRLVEVLVQRHGGKPDVTLGVAPHSLRAVTPTSLKVLLGALPGLGLPACPIHIHVAEQEKEVADCLTWSGKRPVEWLLGNLDVDTRWCLVHATHMTTEETGRLAASGAVAGLCPTTEANLGDGLFPAEAYAKAGGQLGIGSDSHVCVNPFEELRLLEYGQRLNLRRRAVLHGDAASVGRTLYTTAAEGGAKALRLHAGGIAVGRRADLVALSLAHPLLADKENDALLDTLVFALPCSPVSDVFVAGSRVVSNGTHPLEEASAIALRQTLGTLCA